MIFDHCRQYIQFYCKYRTISFLAVSQRGVYSIFTFKMIIYFKISFPSSSGMITQIVKLIVYELGWILKYI